MYLETMERVLSRMDKTMLDNNAGAVPYLPLDRARGNSSKLYRLVTQAVKNKMHPPQILLDPPHLMPL